MRRCARNISLSNELRLLEKTMEQRIYPPSKETVAKALIKEDQYEAMYA